MNDKLIFSKIRESNVYAFEKLFTTYYQALVNFAFRFVGDKSTAEDIVQSSLLYLWEIAGEIKIETSVRAYLYTIVKNACLNHLRSLEIRDRNDLLFIESLLEDADPDLLEEEELREGLEKAVDRLPAQLQTVIRRKYFDDLSIKEIAGEMLLSENTVKVHLFKGRTVLRRIFGAVPQ